MVLTFAWLSGCSLEALNDSRKVNARFDKFTDELFVNEVSANTLNLHYTIANPEKYGITDYPITLGNYSMEAMEKSMDTIDNYLSYLEEIPYDSLSSDRQITYDCIYEKLKTEQQAKEVLSYTEILSATTGFQAQLPVLLAEYAFYDKQDVEDYLALLTKVRPYFAQIVEFEQQKAGEGLFMASFAVEDIVAQCSSFISDRDNHFLISTFENRLEALELTELEKSTYIKKNKETLELYVFPAYEDLITGLTALKDTGTNPYGLCHFEKGKEYYEYLVAANTGSSFSVEELHKQILNSLSTYVSEFSSIVKGNPNVLTKAAAAQTADPTGASPAPKETQGTYTEDSPNPKSTQTASENPTDQANSEAPTRQTTSITVNPQGYMEDLREKAKKDFPSLFHISYTLNQVDESLEDFLSPAFYLTPALDASQNNVIYINHGHSYTPLSLYTTLAHEGFPGHMYQTVYAKTLGQDKVRTLLGTTGYTEGWATYGEMIAYDYAEIDTDTAQFYRLNSQISLAISAALDIGIHYYYWTPEDAMDFLSTYGITSEETATQLYEYIVEEPANYLNYYVGYLEFERLRSMVEEKLGDDFSAKEFHEALLNIGEGPFCVIEKYVKKEFDL